jgi:uncharacterized protein
VLHKKSAHLSSQPLTSHAITKTLIYRTVPGQQQILHARYSLYLFFGLVISLTTIADIFTFFTHNSIGTFFMMWSPGTAALLTRLLLREGFSDISFRFAGKRTLIAMSVAVGIPVAIGSIAYGIAWLSGVTPLTYFHASEGLIAGLMIFGKQPFAIYAYLMVLVLCIEVLAASGEEIGWRGYMLTRLIYAKVPQPVLVSGLIWSFWHWPLFLFAPPIAGLPPQIIRASIFLVTITSLGCISARLRLKTGSIWPSIFLHAAWNVIILEAFDAFTKGTDTSLWTGEAGIFVALTTMVVAFLFTRLR